MNYDFIYSLASEVVFMESKKIDKEGIKTKTTELGYKGKKYNELRKVLNLKHNLIQANHGLGNILLPSVFVRYYTSSLKFGNGKCNAIFEIPDF